MKPPLRLVGTLAIVTLLSGGCGHRTQADTPEPVSQVPSAAAEAPESPAPGEQISGEQISENLLSRAQRAALEERISFEFDQSDLSPAARGRLLAKAEILRSVPAVTLRIEGHADERGSDEYNLALSSRRAASAQRLLAHHGINASRLEIVAYGEERPLDSAENETAWALNRRAEFQVSAGRVARQ